MATSPDEQEQSPPSAHVIPLFSAERRPVLREPPVTQEELAEYRLIRPQLLQMLAEWKQLTAPSSGCPVAQQILRGR